MIKRKISAVLLACMLTLGLCACGGGSDEPTESTEKAVSVKNGTLDAESTVVAVGKTKVSYSEYQAYAYLLKNRYTYAMTEDIWGYATGTNRTIGLDALEDTIRLIIQVKVIGREAAKAKVALGVDEKEDFAYQAEKFLEGVPEADKAKYGLTKAIMTNVLCDNALAKKMYDVVAAKANVNVTDEEAQVIKVQLLMLMSNGTDKNGETIHMNDQEKTALFEQAAKYKSEVKVQKSFYALAEEHSSLAQINFDIGREDSPKELVDTVFQLQKGQVSDVIQTANGDYLAYCLDRDNPAENAKHREELVVERQTSAFQKQYSKWSALYEVRVSKAIISNNVKK